MNVNATLDGEDVVIVSMEKQRLTAFITYIDAQGGPGNLKIAEIPLTDLPLGLATGSEVVPSAPPGDTLPDWLTGFPVAGNDHFEVVIGDKWRETKVPFAEDDVIKLYKIAGEETWSEDGTSVPNLATNRLLLELAKIGTPMTKLDIMWNVVNTGGSFANAFGDHALNKKAMTKYTFGDFMTPGFEIFYYDTYFFTTVIGFYYKNDMFKSMTFVAT
jgi:hypothetical protein